MSGLRMRAVGTAFFQTEVLVETIISFLNPPPPSVQTQAATISEYPSTWLTLFLFPNSLRPCHIQIWGTPKLLPVAFLYKWHVLGHASIFLKSLKGSQNPDKQNLAIECPVPLAEQPSSWQ